MQITVYQIGVMYAILKECRLLAETRQSDRAIMSDVYLRLEESFSLTQEQKVYLIFISLFMC